MLRSFIASACLLVATATAASAQGAGFPGQISPTVATNEQLIRQILEALPSTDLGVLSQQTGVILDLGQQLEQQLSAALATAPDDVARSRVEGVLTHTEAAVESLRLAGQETTLDATRGRLEQARGEAQESLSELQPFVVSVPQPVALPAAGSVYNPEIAALPFLGALLIVAGLALRVGARVR